MPEGTEDAVPILPSIELRINGPWEFDVHTVARGVEECNLLVGQGWRVYNAQIIVHDLVQPSTQRGPVRQPVPYYMMGKRLSADESETRARIVQAASETSDGAPAQVEPAEPDEPAEIVTNEPLVTEAEELPALPARRAAAPRRTGLETTGIR